MEAAGNLILPRWRFRRAAKCFAAFFLLLHGCSTVVPNLRSVADLAPPRNVTYTLASDTLTISWHHGQPEQLHDLAGYSLYVAENSLIFAALADLPSPYRLDAEKTSYSIALDTLQTTYFVHLRSRSVKGDLSLPSLPELEIITSTPDSAK